MEWLRSAEPLPDLILLDINMPGLSGFDVLEAVKADERLKSVPVVMLTSSDASADVARAYELGASGYISKPNYFHDLRAVLGNTLLYWSAMRRATPAIGGRRGMSQPVILLVEDDKALARRIASAVETRILGSRVIHVTSGEEAVLWVGANDCSVCLLDYDLPGIDGLETLARIRQRKPNLPVIMLSICRVRAGRRGCLSLQGGRLRREATRLRADGCPNGPATARVRPGIDQHARFT